MTRYRLSHYLALCGVASRRQSARLIEAQRVLINGRVAGHSDIICVEAHAQMVDDIRLDGVLISPPEAKVYWLYHKPVGVDCRLLVADPASLLHLLPASPRVFPAGRLDKDSRGLLLLTNDGFLSQRIMHPDFHHTKTYQVVVDKPFDECFLNTMSSGVSYQQAKQSVMTRACIVTRLTETQFEIVLTQGLNRQIRRMCLALGYRVIDLKRTAIGPVTLGDLAEAKRRPLMAAELTDLTTLMV
ncbi:RNA pseudouridine synthase [Shewanella holmiensis]|uniref:Pseudouridine synthase n=1 Tax=Shewanella holmiensis TaxID=2952222 RepID=A0A9X3AKZ9_9GAMM|nr:RNA pseudouridine synthase [Shewanella holmiensis]MCT7940787.1 RNA pseudouridine synthase [Shewanella holmiensis]